MIQRIKQHWLQILIPAILMWGAWVTVNSFQGARIEKINTVLHSRITKTEVQLRGEINAKDEEIAELRSLVMDLWKALIQRWDESDVSDSGLL